MKHLLILLSFLPFVLNAQECNCKSIYNWTKTTFEENDAGFQYIIDIKGKHAYILHNDLISEKAKKINNALECQKIVNEWLHFFRKGHIGLKYVDKSKKTTNNNNNKEKTEFNGVEKYSVNIDEFKEYLKNKSVQNFEGIWKTSGYQIGIKQEDENYIGFIISSKANTWKKDQIKLKISIIDKNFNSVYYMRDHSAVESRNVQLLGDNNLQIGNIYLSRVYPIIKDNSPYTRHFKALNSNLPFIEAINKTTLYFRIPSFRGGSEKRAIDSVITLFKDEILSTENLIIDIRNGTGGSDIGYSEILPLIYTNPIRTLGIEFLSTELNNQRMLDFSNNTGLGLEFNLHFNEEERKEFKNDYDKLSENIGKFINLDSNSVSITTFDTIYQFPKNVGIIHNQRNGSTDEQFLLAAKQSKKVKLFGKTTSGTLDISNLNITKSPNKDFVLWYALSKSSRIPDMAIDGKGIQPDYFIDKSIPEYEWINFVSKVLNE